jgi:DNA-binding transcriptional MerR regulator
VLTAQEAADRLGVSVRQLNRYQQAGLIAPVQNVPRGRRRFTETAVDQLQRRLRDEPPPTT